MSGFKGRHIISMEDLSRGEIDKILEVTSTLRDRSDFSELNKGKMLASLFFEPSTRTRQSFERAMINTGGELQGFADPRTTSVSKSESLQDTIRIYHGYGFDVFVIRHPLKGAARLASYVVDVPVINAGDGPNQHPTQTLLDLYTIQQTQGKIDGVEIAMVGDLENGRTVHSLTEALTKYKVKKLYFVSSRDLAMPHQILARCRKTGTPFEEVGRIEDVIDSVDILYMTRVQKERFAGREGLYAKLARIYRLNASMLKGGRENMKVLHPLPRVDEISKNVDDTPHAFYFPQARNGLFVREALLSLVMGGVE